MQHKVLRKEGAGGHRLFQLKNDRTVKKTGRVGSAPDRCRIEKKKNVGTESEQSDEDGLQFERHKNVTSEGRSRLSVFDTRR